MAQLEGNNIDIILLHTHCKKQSFTSKSSQTKTMGWIRGEKKGHYPHRCEQLQDPYRDLQRPSDML